MSNPILESVAKALVINNDNQVLILKLGEYKERPEKSYKPDLPGGLVDPGENEHDAVIREVLEETGIAVNPKLTSLVYSGTEFIADENKSVSKHLFICRVDSNLEVKLSWEHSSYEWHDLEELQSKTVKLRAFYNEAIEYCFTNNILSISTS